MIDNRILLLGDENSGYSRLEKSIIESGYQALRPVNYNEAMGEVLRGCVRIAIVDIQAASAGSLDFLYQWPGLPIGSRPEVILVTEPLSSTMLFPELYEIVEKPIDVDLILEYILEIYRDDEL